MILIFLRGLPVGVTATGSSISSDLRLREWAGAMAGKWSGGSGSDAEGFNLWFNQG